MKRTPYQPVPIDFPVEIPILRPNIVGWKPLPMKRFSGVFNNQVTSYYNEKTFSAKTVRKLFERDGNKCTYCGIEVFRRMMRKRPIATVDHFMPISLGRTNKIDNLVLSCEACNNKKANMLPLDFMKLIWGDDLQDCPHEIRKD